MATGRLSQSPFKLSLSTRNDASNAAPYVPLANRFLSFSHPFHQYLTRKVLIFRVFTARVLINSSSAAPQKILFPGFSPDQLARADGFGVGVTFELSRCLRAFQVFRLVCERIFMTQLFSAKGRNRQRAFTLIELLVVIAIIAILTRPTKVWE